MNKSVQLYIYGFCSKLFITLLDSLCPMHIYKLRYYGVRHKLVYKTSQFICIVMISHNAQCTVNNACFLYTTSSDCPAPCDFSRENSLICDANKHSSI